MWRYGAVVALVGMLEAGLGVWVWRRFRAARFRFGLWADFGLFLAAFGGLAAVLVGVAVRLHPRQPFWALLLGILAFFLPVNGAAEVLRAGLLGRRR